MAVNAAQPHRWNPLAVLGRWGFLLWLTPLLALLTSLIWHLLEFRRDSVAAVATVQQRSSLPSFAKAGPWTAAGGDLSAFCALAQSSELLGEVAEKRSLSSRWQTSPEEATKRLQSLVSCRPIEGALVEVEVQISQGVNAAELCRAILAHAVALHRSANERLIDAELGAGQADIDFRQKELDDSRAKVGELIRSRGAGDPEAVEQRRHFEDLQKFHDQLRLRYLAMSMEARTFEAAAIHAEPSWKSTPWSERLASFASNVGMVFWGSLLLALGLAYLAEALEPRRTLGRALPAS